MDDTTQALLRTIPQHRMGYAEEVMSAAKRYNLPPELLLRTARQESGFNPAAISPAGAIGVMQLMPQTAKSLGVNPFDARQNIDGGARYLSDMLKRFGDHRLALAAYNAGPERVDSFLKGARPLPAETQGYVHAITDGGRWSPAATTLPARPVQTQPVTAAPAQPQTLGATPAQPPGLLQIPGM